MKRIPLLESRRWLLQALDEFEDAKLLEREGRYYLALFLFQQATEKVLKAFLYSKAPSVQVLLTHSIAELLEGCLELDQDFSQVKRAKTLDRYYITTRYPNGLPGGIPSRYFDDPQEAQRARELAEQVLNLVKSKLPLEAKP